MTPERTLEIERMVLTSEGAKRGLTYDDIAPGLPGTWTQNVRERFSRWHQRIMIDRRARPVTVVSVVRRPRAGTITEIVVRVEDAKPGEFGKPGQFASSGPEPETLRFTARERGSFVLRGYPHSGRGHWLRVGSFPEPDASEDFALEGDNA